jgi:signal peptidase I
LLRAWEFHAIERDAAFAGEELARVGGEIVRVGGGVLTAPRVGGSVSRYSKWHGVLRTASPYLVIEENIRACRRTGMGHEVSPIRRRWHDVRREILYVALILCLLSFAVSRWILSPVKISGESMLPNYNDGQPNFINRLAYVSAPPQRGDVVGLQVGEEFYLKRVIGLPGEKIEFRRDTIVVNGQPLEEHYHVRPLLWILDPVQLGANDYFVMGDNRPLSLLGAVRREHIIGKALF